MYAIFTDGSVDPKLKTGYGACLIIEEISLSSSSSKSLNDQVYTKKFDHTSSSALEVETLLWALQMFLDQSPSIPSNQGPPKVSIYTDSQTIINLPNRRAHLEKTGYRNQKQTIIKHREKYQLFFKLIDQIDYQLIQVQGHTKVSQKTKIDRIFSYVDQASRRALRAYRKSAPF